MAALTFNVKTLCQVDVCQSKLYQEKEFEMGHCSDWPNKCLPQKGHELDVDNGSN